MVELLLPPTQLGMENFAEAMQEDVAAIAVNGRSVSWSSWVRMTHPWRGDTTALEIVRRYCPQSFGIRCLEFLVAELQTSLRANGRQQRYSNSYPDLTIVRYQATRVICSITELMHSPAFEHRLDYTKHSEEMPVSSTPHFIQWVLDTPDTRPRRASHSSKIYAAKATTIDPSS